MKFVSSLAFLLSLSIIRAEDQEQTATANPVISDNVDIQNITETEVEKKKKAVVCTGEECQDEEVQKVEVAEVIVNNNEELQDAIDNLANIDDKKRRKQECDGEDCVEEDNNENQDVEEDNNNDDENGQNENENDNQDGDDNQEDVNASQ